METKVDIRGRYTLLGNQLTRQSDGQRLHIQPNFSKPGKYRKKIPACILTSIDPDGHPVRLSGLFEVAPARYSFDIAGINYLLTLYCTHPGNGYSGTASIHPVSEKGSTRLKPRRVLCFKRKKLAHSDQPTNQPQPEPKPAPVANGTVPDSQRGRNLRTFIQLAIW
jgi:hypothetical protein